MGKLHELLAVEASTRKEFENVLKEALETFLKPVFFEGRIKTLQMFDEQDARSSGIVERTKLESSVKYVLDAIRYTIVKNIDCVFQKDTTNTQAFGKIETNDGRFDFGEVPATFLLTLKKELKTIKNAFENIPVLEKGIDWIEAKDEGEGIWKTKNPKETFKTKKFKNSIIVAPATKEHKAQVEVWDDDRNVGKYVETRVSGAFTMNQKRKLIKRIDTLIDATDKARARANCQEVSNLSIGEAIYNYLIDDLID